MFPRKGEEEMGTQPIDYIAILADLEAKKAGIDSAIASVRAAMAAGALGVADMTSGSVPPFGGGPGQSVSPASGTVDIPSNMFSGISIPEAAKVYLSMVNRKQTTKEITEALQEGGMHTTADDFLATVQAGLFRASRKFGEIVKLKDGWGLAAWYKGLRPGPQENGGKKFNKKTKAKSKQAKGKAKARAKTKTTAKPETSPTVEQQPSTRPMVDHKPEAAVEQYINSHHGAECIGKNIAKELNLSPQTVGLLLSKLAHRGRIDKTPDGKFRSKLQKMPLVG